jgi:hypothetical protein
MKQRLFCSTILLGAFLMSHSLVFAQGGAGTTGSRATNSSGGNTSTAGAVNPATGTTGAAAGAAGTTGSGTAGSSSVTNPASDTTPQLGTGANAGASSGTGANAGAGSTSGSNMAPSSSATGSRNPQVGAPGTVLGSTQTTGTNGMSSPDGEGGAGANQGTARVNDGSGNLSTGATPTEAQLGAAPSGASSAPKTGLFRGSGQNGDSNGSSARGGTAPITGSRETNSASVGSNLGRLLPYVLLILAIVVGGPLGFMMWMKRSEGDKRKPGS